MASLQYEFSCVPSVPRLTTGFSCKHYNSISSCGQGDPRVKSLSGGASLPQLSLKIKKINNTYINKK
jgi:hypothetical protein